MKKTSKILAFIIFMLKITLNQAQIINNVKTFSGTNGVSFSLSFTSITNAFNSPDLTTGYGSVSYNYNIGTYTISQAQIDAAGIPNVSGGGDWTNNQPATSISFYQAAAFVNFLNTNQGYAPAYNLTGVSNNGSGSITLWKSGQSGYSAVDPLRNTNAQYFLPTENELYKAAYYNPVTASYNPYSTGSKIPTSVAGGTNAGTAVYGGYDEPASVYQAGGSSAYGVMGAMGNVFQWTESQFTGVVTNTTNAYSVLGGGAYSSTSLLSSYARGADLPSDQFYFLGFRVAEKALAVPEPSVTTYLLLMLGVWVVRIGGKRIKGQQHS